MELSQKKEINVLERVNIFILNSTSYKEKNLNNIAEGLYTYVLVSPEILDGCNPYVVSVYMIDDESKWENAPSYVKCTGSSPVR